MLISLELFVISGENPVYARCLMWACLLCDWACMRVSDLQGVDGLFRDGLKGFLVKTKTTGHDKKVAEVPFFIGRDVGLSGRDWLRTGFDLWMGLGQKDRSFLIFQATEDFEEPIFKFAKPEVISNYMRILWQRLKVPFRSVNDPRWSLRAETYLLGDECYISFGQVTACVMFCPPSLQSSGFRRSVGTTWAGGMLACIRVRIISILAVRLFMIFSGLFATSCPVESRATMRRSFWGI